jgi:hypothetical protein
MNYSEAGKKPFNYLRALITTVIILVVIFVLLWIAYATIEAKFFSMITRQAGLTVTIGSHKGNLFHGYTFNDITVKQTARGSSPGVTFSTPRLKVNWTLARPPRVIGISWDQANLQIESGDEPPEDIPIGAGSMAISNDPARKGWLVGNGPFQVGTEHWQGSANIDLRADMGEIKGTVHIGRLPSRLLVALGSIPSDFVPSGDVILEMDLSGPLNAIESDGSISDPVTREAIRF